MTRMVLLNIMTNMVNIVNASYTVLIAGFVVVPDIVDVTALVVVVVVTGVVATVVAGCCYWSQCL